MLAQRLPVVPQWVHTVAAVVLVDILAMAAQAVIPIRLGHLELVELLAAVAVVGFRTTEEAIKSKTAVAVVEALVFLGLGQAVLAGVLDIMTISPDKVA